MAPSVRETAWGRIVAFYDLLMGQSPRPIVALNRALAVAERDGVEEGQRQLVAVAGERKPARYPFYWAALADLQRRADKHGQARSSYERAMELSGKTRRGHKPAGSQRHPRTGSTADTTATSSALPTTKTICGTPAARTAPR